MIYLKLSISLKQVLIVFSIPVFLVQANPLFFLVIIFILLSCFAYLLKISKELSVEPSFIHNISSSFND